MDWIDDSEYPTIKRLPTQYERSPQNDNGELWYLLIVVGLVLVLGEIL